MLSATRGVPQAATLCGCATQAATPVSHTVRQRGPPQNAPHSPPVNRAVSHSCPQLYAPRSQPREARSQPPGAMQKATECATLSATGSAVGLRIRAPRSQATWVHTRQRATVRAQTTVCEHQAATHSTHKTTRSAGLYGTQSPGCLDAGLSLHTVSASLCGRRAIYLTPGCLSRPAV